MIDVQVISSVRGDVPVALLRRAVAAALSGRLRRAQVSLALVGDARMRRLNNAALAHDYATDVLSFDHGDSPEGRLIELVVCPPVAARAARRHEVPWEQELARYVVHGCLHCAGFDDATRPARDRMWREQERVLRGLFGPRYVQP